MSLRPTSTDALLVIDVQNDFCAGGALAVPDGDEIVPLINQLGVRFEHVLLTQDWHPAGHISFASSHPGRAAFETIDDRAVVPYGPQTLWPDHCLENTLGAALHLGLALPHAELLLRKGFRRDLDSYSAFRENDRQTPTGLTGYLRERGLRRLFLAGLAFDFCVRYSALDAADLGFECIVLEDACRAVDLPNTIADTHRSLAEAQVSLRQSTLLL